MKKIFYLFFFLFIASAITGQICIPETNLPADFLGVYPKPFVEGDPESGIQTEACIGEEYNLTLTVFVPGEYDLGFGFPLLIEEIKLTAVEGLPLGLSVECNRAGCVYPSEAIDCLVLKGIPNAGNTPGDYDLVIKMTAKTNINPNLPLEFPGILAQGKYTIKLNPAGSQACNPLSVFENLKIAPIFLYPNPANHTLYIDIPESLKIGTDRNNLKLIISTLTGVDIISFNLENITPLKTDIGISSLSPGIHIIRIADSAGNILMRNKFVKI